MPILLVIVVICSIAWYLLVYDRDFTRDMLLHQARFFEDQGNHELASWFYDQAYSHADHNESVAIELAERFKEMGNFTQAERTLAGAIADGGSAELYIALCKTYIEQDKLLDAVTMLDNIADPNIKAELDAQRPAVPAVSHEPGFYSEYITLTLTSESGTIYTTTNSEYPSIEDGPGASELTLEGGDNTIYALVLGNNGLVSPLGIFGYTVAGVIEPVTVQDPAIDTAVRQILQVGAEDVLYSNQLWEIKELHLPQGAESYEDFKLLPYIEALTIVGGNAPDHAGIGSLTRLKQLSIQNAAIGAKDLKAIASLPHLTHLTLSNCSLSSISDLSGCSHLTYLDLSSNSIKDASALSFMSGLTYLDLSHNALSSLNDISSLTGLATLDVSYNSLTSVAPLSTCTALETLRIHNNAITDLTGAEGWKVIKTLDAGFNAITDISAVSPLLTLQKLDISNNQLTDISILSSLNGLQVLNFSRNQVTTLPAWNKNCALVSIDGSYNSLETVSGLAGYKNLNEVLMDYNKITAVNALADCLKLTKVSVYGNKVKDVSALTDMGVLVYYNPNV